MLVSLLFQLLGQKVRKLQTHVGPPADPFTLDGAEVLTVVNPPCLFSISTLRVEADIRAFLAQLHIPSKPVPLLRPVNVLRI